MSKKLHKSFIKALKYPICFDENEYIYPENKLNFYHANKYLNNIIHILKKYGNYKELFIKFTKSQPAIYELNHDAITPNFIWSYPGNIVINIHENFNLNSKSIRYIRHNIIKLNELFHFIVEIRFTNKQIHTYYL